jgi:hypothetical protein
MLSGKLGLGIRARCAAPHAAPLGQATTDKFVPNERRFTYTDLEELLFSTIG